MKLICTGPHTPRYPWKHQQRSGFFFPTPHLPFFSLRLLWGHKISCYSIACILFYTMGLGNNNNNKLSIPCSLICFSELVSRASFTCHNLLWLQENLQAQSIKLLLLSPGFVCSLNSTVHHVKRTLATVFWTPLPSLLSKTPVPHQSKHPISLPVYQCCRCRWHTVHLLHVLGLTPAGSSVLQSDRFQF